MFSSIVYRNNHILLFTITAFSIHRFFYHNVIMWYLRRKQLWNQRQKIIIIYKMMTIVMRIMAILSFCFFVPFVWSTLRSINYSKVVRPSFFFNKQSQRFHFGNDWLLQKTIMTTCFNWNCCLVNNNQQFQVSCK